MKRRRKKKETPPGEESPRIRILIGKGSRQVRMINYNGHPKNSALFYWRNASLSSCDKTFFASYFTVSPVELKDDTATKSEKMNFLYPIMIHEPIPVKGIERIIQEARERNATIVDCGTASVKNIKTMMRKALAEYLNMYISYQLEMEHKKDIVLMSDLLVDLKLNEIRNELSKMETDDKIFMIAQLTKNIRGILEEGEDRAAPDTLDQITREIEKLRLGETYDFDRFLNIVKVPGKIAGRITELYIKQFHNISSHNRHLIEEYRQDIASLFTLKELDELRMEARRYIHRREINKTIDIIEKIYRIKKSNPPFASGEDLDRFCKDLTVEGNSYDALTGKYIEKYFLVIDKRFLEAGEIHKEICSLRDTGKEGLN